MLVKCVQSDYKDQCADWSWAGLKLKVPACQQTENYIEIVTEIKVNTFHLCFNLTFQKYQKALEIKQDVCLQNTTNHYCCSGKVNIQKKKKICILNLFGFFSQVFSEREHAWEIMFISKEENCIYWNTLLHTPIQNVPK